MPWTGEPGAGFCPPGVEPWLPTGDPAVNVEAQRDDPASMLTLHRRLLALRRARDDLATGAYETLQAGDGLLACARGRHTVVALNLSGEQRALASTGDVLLGTHGRAGEHARSELRLAPGEGVLLDVR
jgi:glycosidase